MSPVKPWPRTLFGRLAAILATGLALAYSLSLWSAMRSATERIDAMVLAYVSRDVASSVAWLDRLPPAERASWLTRLERPNYRFLLEGPAAAESASPAAVSSAKRESVPSLASALAATLSDRLGTGRVQSVTASADASAVFAIRLSDGTPLTLLLLPPVRRLDAETWLRWLVQAALVVGCIAWAVHVAIRPLSRLADAATRLGEDPAALPLDESGPMEVQRAAVALNVMRRRIADHMSERMQILAAVSHDLRTPITRMRVRCELLADATLRSKLQADLDEMQHLVEEGLALAAADHAATEPAVAVDLHALLDAIVCDFNDAGQPVQWAAQPGLVLVTRPQALRRTVTNLLDNAIKFGGEAELSLEAQDGAVTIMVMDRGPGIAADQIEQALQPFSRLEASRNRASGGTGLGLAIANRLTVALGAALHLGSREGGGLRAELRLPWPDAAWASPRASGPIRHSTG